MANLKFKSNSKAQQDVYEALGIDILDSSLAGYNACIFAYGQTGNKNKASNVFINL